MLGNCLSSPETIDFSAAEVCTPDYYRNSFTSVDVIVLVYIDVYLLYGLADFYFETFLLEVPPLVTF